MRVRFLGSFMGAVVFSIGGDTAFAQSQSYVDLQAGLGYSTNPLLMTGDIPSSAFGRVSAYGFHRWSTERNSTSLSAYLENSSYFRRYANQQAFSVTARTDRAVSENTRLFGQVGFSGDVGGQLGSRFYGASEGSLAPDPTTQDPLVLVDPELYAISQRSYRVSGRFGGSVILSPRDSITGTMGAQRLFLSGDQDELDYTQYDGSLAYDRKLSERVTVGGRLIALLADYDHGRSTSSVGPQATARLRLSTRWDVSAAIGFVRTQQESPTREDSNTSLDLALDGSACRTLEYERLCARVARRTQSSVLGAAPTSTSSALDYSRRLGLRNRVQLTASFVHVDNLRILGVNRSSTYYTVAGSYDRSLNERLSSGVNLSARKLTRYGPNPKEDFSASVFLRQRLGDLR